MTKIENIPVARAPVSPATRSQILSTAAFFIVAATALNAVYFTLRYAFGYELGTYLTGPDDRFADLVKVALSFKSITWKLTETLQFWTWPELYKDYLLHNPYGGKANLALGQLTHFHHPPFSQLLFTLCALLIAATLNPTDALWIWFGIYVLGVVWLARSASRPDERAALPRQLTVLFLCLATYPAMLVFVRGNYNAGFSSIMIAIFLVHCFGRRRISPWSLLALAIAINIRPPALIFLAALPLAFGLRESARKIGLLLLLSAAIFAGSLLIEQMLYPDYTFANFLAGLNIYKAGYIVGAGGDGGNASLWGMIKNSVTLGDWRHHYYHDELFRSFLVACFLLALLSLRIFLQGDRNPSSMSFVLVCLYVLTAPVTAEYHLLVFVAPLLVLSQTSRIGAMNFQSEIVFVASILMLSPKNYIFLEGLSLQTIINPLTLLVAILLMQSKTLTQGKPPPLKPSA